MFFLSSRRKLSSNLLFLSLCPRVLLTLLMNLILNFFLPPIQESFPEDQYTGPDKNRISGYFGKSGRKKQEKKDAKDNQNNRTDNFENRPDQFQETLPTYRYGLIMNLPSSKEVQFGFESK